MTTFRSLGFALALGLLGCLPVAAQIVISPPPTVIPANLTPDTVCFDDANQDVCLSRGGAGILTIAAVGLVNNLDLDIDLETSATQIDFSSPAGAVGITLTALDLTMGAGTQIFCDDGTQANPCYTFTSDPDSGLWLSSANNMFLGVGSVDLLRMRSTGMIIMNADALPLGFDTGGGTGDAFIAIDAANILAQRNGTNGQTLRVYGTFTDAGNGEWLEFSHSGANADIDSVANGGGTATNLRIRRNGDTAIVFQSNDIEFQERITFSTDDTLDIGQTQAVRPRTVYIGTSLISPLVSVNNNTEGGTARLNKISTTDTVTLSGATTDSTTISIPVGAIPWGCSFNVNTAVVDSAGDDTWSAAFITGSTTTLATGAAAAQNTKVDTLIVDEITTTGVAQVQFTPNAGNFSAGVIEIVCYHEVLVSLADV